MSAAAGSDAASEQSRRGSLTVIGTGIRAIGQITVEAIALMENAEALPYLVADLAAERLIQSFNPQRAFSLSGFYRENEPRENAYQAMVEHVLASVRRGDRTVLACYGHPGLCASAPHESIRLARLEGFPAVMLPAVSSLDCLFADLGVDPAIGGCQLYDASDYFVSACEPDPSSHLILWQIGAVGDWNHISTRRGPHHLSLLVEKLCTVHPPSHMVIVYEASPAFGREPTIVNVALEALTSASIGSASTLYVPPSRARRADARWLQMIEPRV